MLYYERYKGGGDFYREERAVSSFNANGSGEESK